MARVQYAQASQNVQLILDAFMPSDPVKVADQLRFERILSSTCAPTNCAAGRILKLERIPMELLLLLVEKRGQLVTRDQIIERIWGKDVFLDTDNSINAAIRKIRQVLKDNPEQPHFVQTITVGDIGSSHWWWKSPR